MSKKMSPLDIANLMGQAAVQKAQTMGASQAPNDQDDPQNSETPMASKSPASTKAKRVAAAKEQEKQKGKVLPQAPKAKF